MDKIIIDENIKSKFSLPAKSLGEWIVEHRDDDAAILHRLKSDGTLGSDRANNIYKIPMEILDAIMLKSETKIEVPSISERKEKWIQKLMEELYSEPFTQKLIIDNGEEKMSQMILDDTNPERKGGKAYSSISSAIKVWNARIRKGEI